MGPKGKCENERDAKCWNCFLSEAVCKLHQVSRETLKLAELDVNAIYWCCFGMAVCLSYIGSQDKPWNFLLSIWTLDSEIVLGGVVCKLHEVSRGTLNRWYCQFVSDHLNWKLKVCGPFTTSSFLNPFPSTFSGFIMTHRLLAYISKDESMKISTVLLYYVRRYIR